LHFALERLESGDHEQAEQLSCQLLDHNRDDIDALLILGLAVGMRGEAAAAAPILNRVAGVHRSHAHPCADLARMLAAQGKAEGIVPQYRACLALTPDDRRLRYGLAECLREGGDGEEAVAILAPALLADADRTEAHEQMGLALAECGRFAEAAEHFREAIARNPAHAGFWANLGMMLKVEGQFDASLEAYEEALARARQSSDQGQSCSGASPRGALY
jgi:Flp pilus assembly protein TadD